MSPRRRRPLRFVPVRANEGAIVDGRHAESEWPRQAVVEMARALDADLPSDFDFKQASWFTRALTRWVDEPVDAGITAPFAAQTCGRPVVVLTSAGVVDACEPGERGRAAVVRDRTLSRWIWRIADDGAATADGVVLTPEGKEKPDGRPSVRV